MNFRIGQKVVCIKSGSAIKKGNIYTVLRTHACPGCGEPLIDIGYSVFDFGGKREICSICGKEVSRNIQWLVSKMFKRIEYNSAHDEILEKFKAPVESPDVPEKSPIKTEFI
jgi:hypothetical protein